MIVIKLNWRNIWRSIGKNFYDPTRNNIGCGFGTDTGELKPVCCKKCAYGLYESKIIMDQVQQLLSNGWAKRCKWPWGSLIVLAAKPHQEHVTNIKDFIWRMCVSYRKLNGVNKLFKYPIPRCGIYVTVINVGANCIWIITLNDCHGFHQDGVRPTDQEKIALFAPENNK